MSLRSIWQRRVLEHRLIIKIGETDLRVSVDPAMKSNTIEFLVVCFPTFYAPKKNLIVVNIDEVTVV